MGVWDLGKEGRGGLEGGGRGEGRRGRRVGGGDEGRRGEGGRRAGR